MCRLSIPESAPAIVELKDGYIPGGTDVYRKGRLGVYDSNCVLVDSSLPYRGDSHVRHARLDRPALQHSVPVGRAVMYLGFSAHQYGHFLLESLSRAWAWEIAGEGLVPVVQRQPPDFAPVFHNFLPGLGGRLEVVGEDTRFERVIVPSPAFVVMRAAYREFRKMCQRISERALPHAGQITEQPVYLSRAGLGNASRRSFVGEDRLERLLEREGFLVVRPETLPIIEQIALFNRHRWIVGPVGSAFHTKLFARQPINLVLLSNEHVNVNFLLCDLLCGGNSHYVNALKNPDIGVSGYPPFPEPVMLDDASVLLFLKQLGLVSPTASFDGTPPDMETYKRQWIEAALLRSRNEPDQKGDLARAIEKLTRTMT